MNLSELFLENFKTDYEQENTINESIFSVPPLVAAMAFKQKVQDEIFSSGGKKEKKKKSSLKGEAIAKAETAKAKLGMSSGSGDNKTVYKLTKEQREVLAEMYNKYGPKLVKQIMDFRNEVIAPYQVIKRNVAENSRLTDKEVHGMTKEEYYKYRESGRRKIEARKDYNKNFVRQGVDTEEARKAYDKATKTYNDFKAGKDVDISASITSKVLEKMGLGEKSFNNWPKEELEKTWNAINELQKLLKSGKFSDDSDAEYIGRKRAYKSLNRENIESQIKNLKENGYSKVNNVRKYEYEDTYKKGSFKTAFANYCLTRERVKELKNNSSNSEYRKFYLEVLESALERAKERNNEEFDRYKNMRSDIEFNKFEEKIWSLKKTAMDEMSGNIEDWYQKIKEEDFKNTTFIKKPESVVKAEREIDAAVKRFEREIAKTVEPEDLEKLKKYRLTNRPITIKELKDPANLFRSSSELKSSKIEREDSMTEDEFFEILKKCYNTKYRSVKELEDAKSKLQIARSSISKDIDEKYRVAIDVFDRKRTLKVERIPGFSYAKTEKEITRDDVTSLANIIMDKQYYSKEEIESDRKKFEIMVSKYKEGEISVTEENYMNSLRNRINKKLDDQEVEE